MGKYYKLLKNTGLFAIASFGSKILSFIMLPVYSYVLSTAEFGTVDIYLTTLNLLVPVVSLSIFDAVFRFVIGSDNEKSKLEYFKTGITFSCLCSIAVLLFSLIIVGNFGTEKLNIMMLVFIVIVQIFISCIQQFVRAINQILLFSISSILYTFLYLICNIIFLVYFKLGVFGYLLSYVIANAITLIFLIGAISPIIKKMGKFHFELYGLNEMLRYCIPLIPNALLLWIMTASDRYFILYYCGTEYNGLYAAASKIPTILSVFTSVFFQAWQLSAIDEANELNSNFSSQVFNGLTIISYTVATLLMALSKPTVENLMSESFAMVWKYIPILLMGIVFQTYSSFYGTIYIAYKKTKSVLVTSALGAVVNIIGNAVFVPIYGVYAACFTTMFSFFIVWIVRIMDTKKNYHFKMNCKFIVASIIVLFVQMLILILKNALLYQTIFICFSPILIYALEKNELRKIINKFRNRK